MLPLLQTTSAIDLTLVNKPFLIHESESRRLYFVEGIFFWAVVHGAPRLREAHAHHDVIQQTIKEDHILQSRTRDFKGPSRAHGYFFSLIVIASIKDKYKGLFTNYNCT